MGNNERSRGLVVSLLIAVLLLVFSLSAAVGYFIYSSRNKDTDAAPAAAKNQEEITTALEEFVVKLSGNERKFIKIRLHLAYTNKKTAKEIEKHIPQIRHAVNTTLMAKTTNDFDVKGLENVIKEIMERINAIIYNGRITNIYVNDIIIQ